MLGDFIVDILVLVLGYAYPALECFKTIETSGAEIIGLRFWCQYWVILAIMTAIEKFGDIFIPWLPLYGAFKLVFIVYLWHPRTMGAVHLYETLLRPFITRHEMEIEKKLKLLMSKSVDLLWFYIKNFADKGPSLAFEILQYVVSHLSRLSSAQNAGRPGPVQPNAPPMQSMPPPSYRPVDPYPPAEPSRYTEPAGTPPIYPTLDRRDEMDQHINRVEEALHVSGVTLRRSQPIQKGPIYPTPDRRVEMDQHVNRVEEALHVSGVNLWRSQPQQKGPKHM